MSHLRAQEAHTAALLEDDPVALYDQAPCGYLSTTPDGVLTKVNATFATWTGFAPHQLVGRSLVSLLSPGSRVFYETRYALLLQLQGSVREVAMDLVTSDGGRLPVLINASLDAGRPGSSRLVRMAVFDATERRGYERQLLHATRVAKEAQRAAEAAQAAAEAAERQSKQLVDTLQATLVPPRLPEVDGLALVGAYRPAGNGSQVGGDFYDVFTRGPDECWVVLGDVSGKGVDAAVVTGVARNAARALALAMPRDTSTPGNVLTKLNELLCQHETDRFCTAGILQLRRGERRAWEVTYSSGGHPPLVRRQRGETTLVESSGQLVGVFDDAVFAETRLTLHPGDVLLLHTDGVTEARRDGEFYGEVRLREAVSQAGDGPAGVVSAVLDEVLDFQRGLPCDDIACLAVTAT